MARTRVGLAIPVLAILILVLLLAGAGFGVSAVEVSGKTSVKYQIAPICCKGCSGTPCCCPARNKLPLTTTVRKTVIKTITRFRSLPKTQKKAPRSPTSLEIRQAARNNCPVCPKNAPVIPLGKTSGNKPDSHDHTERDQLKAEGDGSGYSAKDHDFQTRWTGGDLKAATCESFYSRWCQRANDYGAKSGVTRIRTATAVPTGTIIYEGSILNPNQTIVLPYGPGDDLFIGASAPLRTGDGTRTIEIRFDQNELTLKQPAQVPDGWKAEYPSGNIWRTTITTSVRAIRATSVVKSVTALPNGLQEQSYTKVFSAQAPASGLGSAKGYAAYPYGDYVFRLDNQKMLEKWTAGFTGLECRLKRSGDPCPGYRSTGIVNFPGITTSQRATMYITPGGKLWTPVFTSWVINATALLPGMVCIDVAVFPATLCNGTASFVPFANFVPTTTLESSWTTPYYYLGMTRDLGNKMLAFETHNNVLYCWDEVRKAPCSGTIGAISLKGVVLEREKPSSFLYSQIIPLGNKVIVSTFTTSAVPNLVVNNPASASPQVQFGTPQENGWAISGFDIAIDGAVFEPLIGAVRDTAGTYTVSLPMAVSSVKIRAMNVMGFGAVASWP